MQKKILLTTLLFTIALSGCKDKDKAKDHNHSAAKEKTEGAMTAAMDGGPIEQMMDMEKMTAAVREEEERLPHHHARHHRLHTPTAAMDLMDNSSRGLLM